MPIPTFLTLIAVVIVAAGASIAFVHALGISFVWLSLAALVLALIVRGLQWR